MDTINDAAQYLDLHKTPFWKITQGTARVGESDGSEEMADSIARFRQSIAMLPAGSYKLYARKKENDTRGELMFPFTKGQQTANAPAMQNAVVQSTNAYNIPDNIYAEIRDKERKAFMFEQMYEKFGPMADLVKDLDRRLTKVEKFLKDDDDGDGVPDFLDLTKKASETVKAAGEMKSLFSGESLFS